MGKKRVTQLLEQLKTNQQMDLQNAAAIYTVAQVAVNELQKQVLQDTEPKVAALPPAPVLLNKAELLRRYGSYNSCRRAAKKQGLKFARNPSWKQLATAFSYVAAFQQAIKSYVETYPNLELDGITVELTLSSAFAPENQHIETL
jgi:hypothetical protein